MNQQIKGSLIVTRDSMTSGKATVRGNAVVHGNLRVEGWLDTPNIKTPCKGLYADAEALESAWPEPAEGWWALVGDTLPAEIYVASHHQWTATGNLGGDIAVDLDAYDRAVERIDDRLTAIDTDMIEMAGRIDDIPVRALPTDTADLVLADSDGTPIATFSGGHISTRCFDSANIGGDGMVHPVQVQHTDEAQLIVQDDEGREVMRVQGGHIITGNFNSSTAGGGANEYAGKYLSVIGDSISSKFLDGVTTAANTYWYDSHSEHGVNTVDKMWWKIVADTLGMQMRKVAALGGTTVTGNSQESTYHDACAGCSTARIEAIADGIYTPDVVIVYMGFNDWNAGRTVGTLTSAAPAEGTVNTFTQAYLLMVLKAMRTYPKAKVCCCTVMDCHRGADTSWPVKNSQGATVADFNAAIRQVCDMTGALCIDVHSCGVNYNTMAGYSPVTDGLHPNVKGQQKIAEKIVKTLKSS